jgi:prepilin peptidase CpaA
MGYFHFFILGIIILIAFYTDVKTSRLPNWLSLLGIVAGFVFHGIDNGWHGLLFSFIGLLLGFGIMLILYFFKALGAGDVKLFAAIGAITGTEFVLYAMVYSIIYAGVIGLVILIARKEVFSRMFHAIMTLLEVKATKKLETMEQFKRKESYRFPFMYAVLPGVITTLYYFVT